MTTYTQEQILAMDLPQLMDACEAAFHSERNAQLKANDSQILYRVGIGRTVFARAFGFKTLDYYHDMKECLKQQLRGLRESRPSVPGSDRGKRRDP